MKGEGGKIKNSPLSPCGRGVGGEGDYKNGMLPILCICVIFILGVLGVLAVH
jgi:hypothetical protein